MTAKEFMARFEGVRVRIHGHHPGRETSGYQRRTGKVEKAWPVPMLTIAGKAHPRIGFSACGYTWPGIDYWHEGDVYENDGRFYGYYTAAAHPDDEPGMVCIEVVTEKAEETCPLDSH